MVITADILVLHESVTFTRDVEAGADQSVGQAGASEVLGGKFSWKVRAAHMLMSMQSFVSLATLHMRTGSGLPPAAQPASSHLRANEYPVGLFTAVPRAAHTSTSLPSQLSKFDLS